MNKIVSVLLAIILSAASADIPATHTDLDYDFGPLEIVDDLDQDDESDEPYVYIEIVNPPDILRIGDQITMRCVVVGLKDTEYNIQWQYCRDLDLEEYQDIDCREPEYTFTASYENIGYYYRVIVTY